jgi:selenide,water dikinase
MTDKEKKRLTHMSSKAGCASKFAPGDLAQVLKHLDKNTENRDENLIVGFDLCDDAGVYRITPDIALVQTVDFFTPIVDDPFLYGQIAAANALSDVYAMGGKPLTALSIACFSYSVDPDVLVEILRGGESKIKEAGALLLGGHTVSDEEIKYGLSITGTVHPDRVVTNTGAKPGDLLILTKPIGTGIITTAFKFDKITELETQEATTSMATLNKNASEAMQRIGVHACTDVTGFSLLGHGSEMATGSDVQIRIHSKKVPIMKKVIDMIGQDAIPGGAFANKGYFGHAVHFERSVEEPYKIALFDPQTSGGLLIAVAEDKAMTLLDEINKTSTFKAEIIGEVLPHINEDTIKIIVD